MFFNYTECPICGRLIDDGAFYHVGKSTFLVCFDCDDDIPDSIIKDMLEKIVEGRRRLDEV